MVHEGKGTGGFQAHLALETNPPFRLIPHWIILLFDNPSALLYTARTLEWCMVSLYEPRSEPLFHVARGRDGGSLLVGARHSRYFPHWHPADALAVGFDFRNYTGRFYR